MRKKTAVKGKPTKIQTYYKIILIPARPFRFVDAVD